MSSSTPRPGDKINWWPLYIGLAVVCLLLAWMLRSWGAQFIIVILVPVIGWIGARLIIGGLEHAWSMKHRSEWEEWQGINYGYGPYQLRALDFENALWFYERDILAACGQRNDVLARLLPASERRLLEGTKLHVLNEAGCEHLLLKIADPEAKKLLMYLRREAYFPFKRARGQAVDVPTSRGTPSNTQS